MVASDRPRPNAIAIFQVFICSPPGGFGCRAIRSPSCRHAPTGNSHKDTKAQRKKRMRGAVAGFPLSRYSLEGWRIRSLQDGPHPAGTGTPEALMRNGGRHRRSEEHTSELQSLMRISYAVFCLKKKKIHNINNTRMTPTTTP